MLHAGDESGRTQRGNNNAYCQDNEISWLDWQRSVEQEDLLRFTKYVIEMRRNQPVLKRRRFFQGKSVRDGAIKDITWFAPTARRCRRKCGAATRARSACGSTASD